MHGASSSDHPGTCGNCGAQLVGPYCAQCGQHAHVSARNLAGVIHDGWHDLTHLDGRLWHTLGLLLGRPGRLTLEYFEEHRARYLPPVRLYLVLSVLFFGLGLSLPHGGVPIVVKQDSSPAAASAPQAAPGAQRTWRPAEDEGFDLGEVVDCDSLKLGTGNAFVRVLDRACRRNAADHWRELPRTLVHNIPKMMFVFLPLMAAAMLLLYWRPRRFYVEHLVFLLHNHSAVYLAFALMAVLDGVGRLWPAIAAVVSTVSSLGMLYVGWYPYAAMRRFYGQGRALTLVKYALLAVVYAVFSVLTLGGTALISVLET